MNIKPFDINAFKSGDIVKNPNTGKAYRLSTVNYRLGTARAAQVFLHKDGTWTWNMDVRPGNIVLRNTFRVAPVETPKVETPTLAVELEQTAGCTQAEVASLVEVVNSCRFRTLDAADYHLQHTFPGWFVYRGGNHVALHRASQGPRVLIVTEPRA